MTGPEQRCPTCRYPVVRVGRDGNAYIIDVRGRLILSKHAAEAQAKCPSCKERVRIPLQFVHRARCVVPAPPP